MSLDISVYRAMIKAHEEGRNILSDPAVSPHSREIGHALPHVTGLLFDYEIAKNRLDSVIKTIQTKVDQHEKDLANAHTP